MPRRRPPRGFYERLVSANESMIPGTLGGRVSSAAPILDDAVAATIGGEAGVSDLSTSAEDWVDEFTLVSTGEQTVTLTYLPTSDKSVHVELNGLEQRNGTDWTRDGRVITLTNADGTARTGFKLDVHYRYRFGAPVAPAEPFETFVVADDPLFFFRLGDEPVTAGSTVVDYSGNSRNGLFSGTTLTHVASPGLITNSGGDGAISSAGTISDGVELAYASWMNVTQASWEFWISSTDADGGRIFARESPSYVWSIQGGAGSPIYFLASATTIATSTSTDYFDGNPHHVVITYDGTTVRFYKDGVADGSTAWAGPLPTATNSAITLLHAVGTNVNASLIVGTLDEVAMYGYALSDAQVLAHYNAGVAS